MNRTQEQDYIQLIQEHQGVINKILYLYADDAESKKDLKQDILVEAWKSYPSFEGRSQFSTWLYRIGLNVAFARLRKNKKQHYVPLEETNYNERTISKLQGQELLDAILRLLQPVEKSIVLLLIEGYNQKEISELIGLSAVNTRVKVSRLRRKLAEYGFKNIA